MILQMHLIWFLCTMLAGSSGQTIVVTQTPESLTVLPEETVTIQCKPSRSVGNEMNLYLLQPGETPKLMLYHVTNRFTGVPDRFSGRYSGTDFTFTISGVQVEDAGDYCCGHDYGVPLTFGGGTKVEIKRRENAVPSGLIFQPSAEQLEGGQATVVCLVSGFYPSALNVVWKVDGTAKSDGVLTSSKQTDSDNTYSLSSTLSLTKQQYEAHDLYTCEITHVTLSQPLAKSFKRSECTA